TRRCVVTGSTCRPLLRAPCPHALGRFLSSFCRFRPPPGSTLFPSTTLFRSPDVGGGERVVIGRVEVGDHLRVERLPGAVPRGDRSEEHTSELQSLTNLVCRRLLEQKNGSRCSQQSGRCRLHTLLSNRSVPRD